MWSKEFHLNSYMLLNKVYTFKVKQPTFGNLSIEQVNRLYKDGRMSKFLELEMTQLFPLLDYVDKNGHDYEMKSEVQDFSPKIEMKCFTQRGLKFMPSSMIGVGRKIDIEKFHEKANDLTYLFCDIVEFPEIKVIFKRGDELIDKFPRGSITYKHRNDVFSD